MKTAHKITQETSLSDHMQFLRRLIANPRNVGAIAPSGHMLARAMVDQIEKINGPVLELGPGSGSVTRELLARGLDPQQVTVVERDLEFVKIIADRFPGINILHGDALNLDQILPFSDDQKFSGALSGLPLLNFPAQARQKLVNAVLDRLQPGAPLIQFSYGLKSPVAASENVTVTRTAFVWNNLPPARVWVYRRHES